MTTQQWDPVALTAMVWAKWLLSQRGVSVKRYMKPTVAKPAPLPLRQQIVGEVDLVVEGLAD